MIFSAIARHKRVIALVLGFLFAGIAAAVDQEPVLLPTLITVLRDHSLPAPPGDLVDAAVTITSFGLVDEPSQFAIAYYKDNGSEALQPPLYVLRYNKTKQTWYATQFSEVELAKMPGQDGNETYCVGSAGLKAIAGVLLVSTHLSPSAECTIVLTPELKVQRAFSGWVIANVSSALVFQRSEVHFAPTHPLRIGTYDVRTARD